MNNINEILLRRKNMVNVVAGDSLASNKEKIMVSTIAKNIEPLGFMFSKDLFNVLLTFSAEQIENFYKDLIPKLKRLVGADVETYRMMYPNFPQQVAEASDGELIFNALIHYFTCGQILPEYAKDERLPLLDENKMTVLSVGNTTDIIGIMSNLLSSKTSLSPLDKKDIEDIISEYADYYKYLPDEIPLKENVAFLCKTILNKAAVKNSDHIQKYFKTATDVLRLITALSDGDISLSEKTMYRNLNRAERRMIMNLLSDCGDITEDLFRYQYEWIRIGEIIHPFEYKSERYKNVNKAFELIRKGDKPLMFGGQLQKLMSEKNMKSAADLLVQRPGEFARRLDKVLRDANDKNYIINSFKSVANNISTPVLLQVRQHFIGRNNESKIRVFFPKGNLARAVAVSNNLPDIENKFCSAIVKICDNALQENYKSRDFMGSVYIDPEFKNYIVPFSQRSASDANKILVRGSRIPINENATTTRAFIWWTNIRNGGFDSRVDIDLSAAIYDENWNFVEHISYTRLRSDAIRAYHSGDITNGGSVNGAGVSEFLDVNINAVATRGRYIVYQIYSYTGQKFADMPNCRFGWMERDKVNSGEVFEPSTVAMNLDVTSKSRVAIPVIFDCKERKFIWCDMNLGLNENRTYNGGNNLESNLYGVGATCYAMTHLNKANLYDLIMLNAKARGMLTTDRNEADIIFSNDTTAPVEVVETEDERTGIKKFVQREKNDTKIITSFDIDYFMGQML